MIYLISQDWINTTNNHTGIKYLANELEKQYPNKYVSIFIPDLMSETVTSSNRIIRKVQQKYYNIIFHQYINKLIKNLLPRLTSSDCVVLLEYLEKSTPQLKIAQAVKQYNKNIPVYAMVHLIPRKYDKSFTEKELSVWVNPIDKFITLGHSLSEYFIKRGIPNNKIFTTFHYVDNFYIKSTANVQCHDKTRIIAMGNQARNIPLLSEIVKKNPEVFFIICQGCLNLSHIFDHYKNVQLIPYVEENKLKQYMDDSDISLNSMEDTVGSNVIVTSMAMGLAMICSDVGSIRDYCNEQNTLFCKNDAESFSKAIATLNTDRELLKKMKLSAAYFGAKLNIKNFEKDFYNIIQDK